MTDPEKNNSTPRHHPMLSWWRVLHGADGARPDRAALTELRRCTDPMDAFFVPAFHRLLRRYPRANHGRLAVAAIVLAHVKEHRDGSPVARRIGPTTVAADDAVVSEARFRRLLRAQGDDELLRAMVRLVKMLKGGVNAVDLANSILYWGDSVRIRWAFSYFNAEEAAPAHPVLPGNHAISLS